MSINAIGSTPTAWPVGSGQEGCEPGTEPSALTEKLMWGDAGATWQSAPGDAGSAAPTSGLLVDEYA